MPPFHPLIQPTGRPKVLIVGAGLAGITLAILLEKAGVPYDVYERATEVKPLGAALYIGPNMAPLFHQIGIYDEFVSRAKSCHSIDIFDEQRQPSFTIELGDTKEIGGFVGYVLPRSSLYEILLKQVPSERVHMGKKVLSTLQNENGVMIRCSDGSTVEGDILVGADGAYSGVRQSLFQRLKKDGHLPGSDMECLPYSCVRLVGHSDQLDPAKFPEMKDQACHFTHTLADDKPYSWLTWTTADDRICWGVNQYLDKKSIKDNDTFRNTEWRAEMTEAMCKEVRGFSIPGGDGTLTLGDLIDNTPKKNISKVMLEEKVNPAGAQGALLAFHDAIALANWINILPSTSIEDAEMIFKEYRDERMPYAKGANTQGHTMAQVSATGIKASIIRYFVKNIPAFVQRSFQTKNVATRPQVSFLPLVEDKGTVKPAHQPSLHKTLEILQKR
ncbi:hypothetical protein BG011_006659 [Mortierella polycephala]|uniref:FAD-binding domain-containing protein n=1 Tax=Mortierella polycephala TaxID=41804 RepID=A0A9P6U8S8_9FUNG|nr:hypothetical protein BG011_006659 [Mortierella polycephala]